MRLAQVAPLWESVPPTHYGGVERFVSYLTEELVQLGHEVTLFATGDSKTRARLEAVCPHALCLNVETLKRSTAPILLLERAFGSSQRFDIIHSHLDYFAFPVARRCDTPVLHTVHGRLDLPDIQEVFSYYPEAPLISISHAQRQCFPVLNWVATIHHGLPRNLYRFHPGAGKYLAFLGRLASEKGPDVAIEIAKRANTQLRIAAKVDPADQTYFEGTVAPLLSHPLIEFVGEISDREKEHFLGDAMALVAPYDWSEPFGLVFIEALACGTPVIALRRGSIPEIVDHGRTGYVCDSVDSMVAAIASLPAIDRRKCRSAFEARFTTDRMTQDYVNLYERVIRWMVSSH